MDVKLMMITSGLSSRTLPELYVGPAILQIKFVARFFNQVFKIQVKFAYIFYTR